MAKRLKLKQQSLMLKQLLGPVQDEEGRPLRSRERIGDLWRHRERSRSTEAALGMIEWLASRKQGD